MKSPGESFRASFFRLCETQGWAEPLWLETTKEDTGLGQAREALDAGVDVVIAAGGDGTVRCVAEVLAGTGTPMGLVPLGTGNLLARNLGVDITDPVAASYDVLSGTDTKVDVVKARLDHAEEEHIFLVMAGLGYDAAIMANTVDELKDRVGWLAYVEAGIRHLPGKPIRAKISIDGQHAVRRRIRSVMVGNCGKIMGGVEIFPEAKVDDGILDVVILAPVGRLGWLGVLAGVFGRNNAQGRLGRILRRKVSRDRTRPRAGIPARRRPPRQGQAPQRHRGARGPQHPDDGHLTRPSGLACPAGRAG